MKKILAFSGSNSKDSINQKLIQSIAPYFSTNIEVEILNLRDFPAPIFGVDLEKSHGFPETMQHFRQKMIECDAILLSSPEHNGSMPAVLKNTLDWISRMGSPIFQNKPLVFLSASTGARAGASVLKHLNEIMPFRGAEIVGSYGIGNFEDKIKDGVLIDASDKAQIIKLIQKLEDVLKHQSTS